MTGEQATALSILSDEALRQAMIVEAIPASAGLRDVITHFRDCPELEALPVVDEEGRPIGAVLERDVRRLLLNPFGHALLCNSSLYHRLDGFVTAVPVAEITTGLGDLFSLISQDDGHEAVILVSEGRFRGALSGRTLLRMAAQREARVAARRQARLHWIDEASALMRDEAASLAREIAGASDALERGAGDVIRHAGDVGSKGLSVMAAAAQAADNVYAIADQGQDLVGALSDLGGEVAAARASTARVAELIEAGGRKARQLDAATGEIGAVVETIDAVARRINLLALNATIEAARAGEAGRGFAVVASEVKSLARQTREAAGQIGLRIRDVQSGVGSVAAGQAGIETAVATLDGLSETIDAAVARNRSAGERVSGNVREAAGANGHIREQAAEISATASAAAAGAGNMAGIARSLTIGTDRLRERLGRFLDEIQVA